MTALSKQDVNASLLDLRTRKVLLDMIEVATIAATGSTESDAASLTAGINVVTASDGTKGVILPRGKRDTRVEVINTVATLALKVYPNTGAQINALTVTTGAFTQAAGSRAIYVSDADAHWYVAAANLTGTATVATQAELDKLAGVTAGVALGSKAAVLGTTKNLDTLSIDPAGFKSDGVVISPLKWVDVTVTAALLDAAGSVNVIAGVTGDQYKVRNIRIVGGGTNFGAGGDRLINLTDGITVWTTIANADIEVAPATTLEWGNAKVPFLTGTSDTASASAAAIRFQYSGGTTDHGGVGSIKFSVGLEKVA